MCASYAAQKPVFQIPFFSLLTASLSRDLISPFPANYFFQLSFSRPPPPGAWPNKKTPSHLLGGVSALTHLLVRPASAQSGHPGLRRRPYASTPPFTACWQPCTP